MRRNNSDDSRHRNNTLLPLTLSPPAQQQRPSSSSSSSSTVTTTITTSNKNNNRRSSSSSSISIPQESSPSSSSSLPLSPPLLTLNLTSSKEGSSTTITKKSSSSSQPFINKKSKAKKKQQQSSSASSSSADVRSSRRRRRSIDSSIMRDRSRSRSYDSVDSPPRGRLTIEERRRRQRLRLRGYYYTHMFPWKRCLLIGFLSFLFSFLFIRYYVIEKNGLKVHLQKLLGTNGGVGDHFDDDFTNIDNNNNNNNNNNNGGDNSNSSHNNNFNLFSTTTTTMTTTTKQKSMTNTPPTTQQQQPTKQPSQHPSTSRLINKPSKPNNKQPTLKLKKILFYTKYWNDYDFQFGYGQEPFIKYNCPNTNCYTESYYNIIQNNNNNNEEEDHQKNLSNYDAVLFHMIDFHQTEIESINKNWRSSKQRFIMFNMESPQYIPKRFDNPFLKGFFNWTMTYRLDSDIPRPYGSFQLKRQNDDDESSTISSIMNDNDSHNNNLSRIIKYNYNRFIQSDTYKNKELHYLATKRQGNKVAWIVSNCYDTPSKRELYVRELSKYIQVDVFGKCSLSYKGFLSSNTSSSTFQTCNVTRQTLDIPELQDNCTSLISNEYKFYLSFENSICNDYITEKLYKRMYYNSLPIVLGKNTNYLRLVPEHSYINIFDFKNAKELATYLQKLDINDDEYLSYFWYKDYYDIDKPSKQFYAKSMCNLCTKLNNNNNEEPPKKIYHDIKDWWINGGQCIDTTTTSTSSSSSSSTTSFSNNNVLNLLPSNVIHNVKQQEAFMTLPKKRMPWDT